MLIYVTLCPLLSLMVLLIIYLHIWGNHQQRDRDDRRRFSATKEETPPLIYCKPTTQRP